MNTVIYPGTFDPITNGHLDLIDRSRALFDETVIAVARNVSKNATLDAEERMELLEAVTADMPDVSVQVFDGLVVHHAQQIGANALQVDQEDVGAARGRGQGGRRGAAAPRSHGARTTSHRRCRNSQPTTQT